MEFNLRVGVGESERFDADALRSSMCVMLRILDLRIMSGRSAVTFKLGNTAKGSSGADVWHDDY